MKKKVLLISIIIMVLLLLTILITNILYDTNEYNLNYSYNCCDDKNGIVYYQAPCKCKSDKNVLEKTLIVLGIK